MAQRGLRERAGMLIEAMIAWLDRGLDSTADQVIEDYTRSCAAALAAALSRQS